MESLYTKKVLYGSKKECARTDTVFLSISEVCDGTVSLLKRRRKTKKILNKHSSSFFESIVYIGELKHNLIILFSFLSCESCSFDIFHIKLNHSWFFSKYSFINF